ncbi:gliding motility-associated C-terminal domain-containing protein, partial [Flavobacterium sp. LB1P62]|uniref:gliding motility-associated C-terminal domain-containing protein n=1 Tax=Flavobacterium sp. LB1P62 TaxID=3401715 RepID=UPI003AAEF2DB
ALACWETRSFDATTCTWKTTGTEPAEPTTALACWETRSFDATTCTWKTTGTEPAEPTTALACWETRSFDATTCTWKTTGTEPAEPNAGTDGTLTVCSGATPTTAQLNAAVTGEDVGGTWTNSGLIYTYTVSATAPCTGTGTATVTVTVQAAPIAGTTTNFSIVVGGSVTLELLNAHISGNQSGTWNATSGGAGTYTYTVAATSPCSVAATVDVVVKEQAPPNPGIFHTTVTSSDFISGATDKLIGQLCYTTKNGKVTNVTPGQMFYYTAIKAPSNDFYVDIEETKSESGLALFEINQKNQITLWDAKYNKVATGTQTVLGKGQIHISNAVKGAQYVLSVKYDTKSIIGSSFSGTAPVCTYTFVSKINGSIVSRTSVDMTPDCSIVSRTNVDMTPDYPIVLGKLECAIEVFNAISPNGDGSNDFFRIEGLDCYPENRVEIYNRWGVLVFERTGYNNDDRVFRGLSEGRVTIRQSEELPTGTYFYIFKYKDTDSKGHEKSGYLYLNR